MNQKNMHTRSSLFRKKTIENTELYHVVIFPCDNSFSVVKAKQCTPAQQDGFIFVQSGGKKYMGFIFESGSFEICSKAADTLSQKQHNDIESDYEQGKENSSSKATVSKSTEERSFTTLKDVPFTIDNVLQVNQNSIKQSVQNLGSANCATPVQIKNRYNNEETPTGWRRTRNTNYSKNNAFINNTTSADKADYVDNPIDISSSQSITENFPVIPKVTTETNSLSNDNSCKRTVLYSSSPKRKKKSKSLPEVQDISSSDSHSDDDEFIQSFEPVKTPTFNGRHLSNSKTTDLVNNKNVEKDSLLKDIEKKYLIPLLVGQERLELMMKSLYKNQLKIQKALNKRQIQLSLEEPGIPHNEDPSLLSELIFKPANDEPSVDLLKIHGTKEKANLYVTNLIQILYTMEELVALQPAETYTDDRYKLIQEAVRCKFKLDRDQLEQMFNDWLREVFLAKRRVAVAKMKSLSNTN